MSRLKLSDNLFLGSKELNFLTNTLSTDGFKRLFPDNVFTYGVVIDSTTPNSLRVIQDPNNVNMVLVQDGALINGSLDYGTYTQNALGFSVPANGTLYITATIQESNQEPGTVTIDADGNVTGVGTSFTETIRGLPNFASKVMFPDASVNVNEYEVREVVSDTLLRLNVPVGSLGVESIPQAIEVIGTFTPGVNIPNQDKRPFVRSSISVGSTTTEPIVGSNLFRLASVTLVGGSAVIVDERSLNLYSTNNTVFASTQLTFSTPVVAQQNIPRGLNERYVKIQASQTNIIFNGMSGYEDGEVVIVQNSPFSARNLIFNHQSSASLPNNVRVFSFVDAQSFTLEPGHSAIFVYNTLTNNQWQLVSTSNPLRPLNTDWVNLGSAGWSVDSPTPNSVNTSLSSVQGVRYKIIGNTVTMSVDISIIGNGNGVLILRLAESSSEIPPKIFPLPSNDIGVLEAYPPMDCLGFVWGSKNLVAPV